MKIIERLDSFLFLKNRLNEFPANKFSDLVIKAHHKNPWFTEKNIRLAFDGIIEMLNEESLKEWSDRYPLEDKTPKNIGVIMAGNIPMVGFHDLLCVLLSNHNLKARLSSQDDVLIPFIIDELVSIDPWWGEKIEIVEKIKEVDAVIATGSDNTSRYFEYYFRGLPKILRKNRTSLAIITGHEDRQELKDLGKDIYQYFGLGCRNVSKILLPEGYNLIQLLDELNDWAELMESNKYMNNYTYNRAIFSIEKIQYLDNGYSLFTQSDQPVSPTAVVYYDFYRDNTELKNYIDQNHEKIQCLVGSKDSGLNNIVPFGKAQQPKIWDYADNVDTMKFLTGLN